MEQSNYSNKGRKWVGLLIYLDIFILKIFFLFYDLHLIAFPCLWFFFQKIMTCCQETSIKLEKMTIALDGANIDLQNVNNKWEIFPVFIISSEL